MVLYGLVFLSALGGLLLIGRKRLALRSLRQLTAYPALSLMLAAAGCLGLWPASVLSVWPFIWLQLYSLGLGYIAAYLLGRHQAWKQPGLSGSLMVTAQASLGMLGFALVFDRFQPGGLGPFMAWAVMPFVLPQFLKVCFRAYRSIPQEIYKLWYYPLHASEIDFDTIDTSTIYMLELEYSKSIDDNRIINTKLRAPVHMKFGDWFRSFLENYNHKYESDPIHYLLDGQRPQGWIFSTKPGWTGTARFIDPDLTIADNQISEQMVILARRVSENQ